MDLEELFRSALDSYRAALVVIGKCGVRICPQVGHPLQLSLLNLQERLSAYASAAQISETGKKVEEELETWGGLAAGYFQHKTNELKEIMIIMARTAEALGERDQRYAGQFGSLTARLRSIAELDDLSQIRQSLVTSASELNTCVAKMTQDGQQSVARLRAELSSYRTRLEDAERRASRDALTDLANRGEVERELELRMAQSRAFSILMFDLNGFKQINDAYGHLAGDHLLKQFATELRSVFRSTDVVGRWGGDEFIVVLDCSLKDATSHIDRIRQWAFGQYTVETGAGPQKVSISAAIGAAARNPDESLQALIARADAAMYREKSTLASAAL